MGWLWSRGPEFVVYQWWFREWQHIVGVGGAGGGALKGTGVGGDLGLGEPVGGVSKCKSIDQLAIFLGAFLNY